MLVRADLLPGSYVDPGLSRRSLRVYAELWLAAQPVRETTRRCYDSQLRNSCDPGGEGLCELDRPWTEM